MSDALEATAQRAADLSEPANLPQRRGDAPVPELKDVPGPAALGGDRRRMLELLWILAVNDFKRTYFGTVLGYLWTLARPLMLFGVLLAVFTQVFRLGSEVPHYPVLLLFNIVLFGFFQEATGAAVFSVPAQESLVRKTQFPRIVIPLAVVLTSLFNLGLNLVVVLVFMLAFGVTPMWTWLLFPLVLATLILITTAVSTIVSSLYPRFRDIAIIWTVASTVLFYATPILYPADKVPSGLRDVIMLNPLAPLFELSRKWFIDPTAPGPVQLAGGWARLIVPAVLFVAICVLAIRVLEREAPRIAEEL
jgi:ABC-2 type transport system permease protein